MSVLSRIRATLARVDRFEVALTFGLAVWFACLVLAGAVL